MAEHTINLFYCKRCKLIIESKNALILQNKNACPKCKRILFYFGREKANISAPDILKDYDENNEINPLQAYVGQYYTDLNKATQNTEMLECEDILRHDPENKEALEFLAKQAISASQFNSAKGYAQRLFDIDQNHYQANQILSDIYIYHRQFSPAIKHIRNCLLQKKGHRSFERLGYCFLKIEDPKNAFEAFARALKHAKSPEAIARISGVLEKFTP